MTAPAGPLVVLAAGGTGGHMFPAEALAMALAGRGCAVALATDARGAAFAIGAGTVTTHRIRAGRLSGGMMKKLGGAVDLARGIFEAGRLLRRLKPAAAVGFGGYASVPTMLAATRAGIATVIHEQNAVLGRANRLLAPRVDAIATSFETVAGVRPGDRAKITRTGNPVRAAIAALGTRPYPAAAADGPFHLLVTGGSQGATALSRVVPEAVAALPETARRRLRITQQCRAEDVAGVAARYRALEVTAEVGPFFENLPERLAGAQLVICRAGASSVAEVTAAGRPAILVPYPFAADDHQSANARAVAAGGGAWLIPEAAFSAAALAGRLAELMATPETLVRTAAAAHAAGNPEAAARLAEMVAALLPNGDGRRETRPAPPRPTAHPKGKAA